LAITEGTLSGEAFHLYEGRNIIGSSSLCDIQIPGEGIQTQHFSLRFSSGKWTLTDFDTDDGTYLNGERVSRAELKDGDNIRVGKAHLRIKTL
jgi:pSer/pThr/pTyr-binding forkhead associated (FHA) protein